MTMNRIFNIGCSVLLTGMSFYGALVLVDDLPPMVLLRAGSAVVLTFFSICYGIGMIQILCSNEEEGTDG